MTAPVVLHTCAGEVLPLPVDRWLAEPSAEEEAVLDRVLAPALDVGCGPGRIVLALARRGVTSLGVDPSPGAATLCRERGAPVLERSVFDRIPGTGRWGTALLMDGNVGIGGDPEALIRRLAALVRPGGRILVELEPPGAPTGRRRARLAAEGGPGPWFPWARAGADDAVALAAAAGCHLAELWEDGSRWFARLDRP
jgi:SAM-dependent methyltransferase